MNISHGDIELLPCFVSWLGEFSNVSLIVVDCTHLVRNGIYVYIIYHRFKIDYIYSIYRLYKHPMSSYNLISSSNYIRYMFCVTIVSSWLPKLF